MLQARNETRPVGRPRFGAGSFHIRCPRRGADIPHRDRRRRAAARRDESVNIRRVPIRCPFVLRLARRRHGHGPGSGQAGFTPWRTPGARTKLPAPARRKGNRPASAIRARFVPPPFPPPWRQCPAAGHVPGADAHQPAPGPSGARNAFPRESAAHPTGRCHAVGPAISSAQTKRPGARPGLDLTSCMGRINAMWWSRPDRAPRPPASGRQGWSPPSASPRRNGRRPGLPRRP